VAFLLPLLERDSGTTPPMAAIRNDIATAKITKDRRSGN